MRKDEARFFIKAIMLSKKFFIAMIAVMGALALVCLVCVFFRFVGIGEFEIEGETDYKLSELVSASGLRTGDRLYEVNSKEAEELLLRGCPYLKSVNVKKKFPNKICFEVEERVLGWYIEISDDYYALDYDMLVLLETYDEEALIERGLTKLVLPELESAMCDYLPEFGRGDEHLISETLKIVDTFRTHSIKERLTYLDLSNRFEIKLTIDGSFDVKIGDMNNMDTKLKTVVEVIEAQTDKGYVGGEINMITPTSYSFKGVFADAPEEEESGEKEPDDMTE
jgi:hypothetical protein